MTPLEGLELLHRLGATPWLVRHHELVLEAAVALCDRLHGAPFDREAVLLGAVLHDAGKIVHRAEMTAPGHLHEAAGRALLVEHGVEPAIARFCVTHADWETGTLEDLLVAAADKLWKGKRDEPLERALVASLAAASGEAAWTVFERVDRICEAIADDGPARLARSAV